MKPAWDKLGDIYADSSVVIADADCTVHTDLCSDHEVRGYPTIKYFTAESGKKGEDYNGGRDFDTLNTFVKDKLETKCDSKTKAGCDDREKKYPRETSGRKGSWSEKKRR